MSYTKKLSVAVAALAFSITAIAQAPAKPTRLRGSIVSLNGDTLVVHRRSGDTVSINVKPDTRVSAVKNITLADIKPGSYVGTAAMTGPGGKMTATEVLVFPEAARGSGEGHYAWDFGPQSTMTNANVDTVVQGTNGRDLKLSYKGGTSTVTVPANVPIVTPAPATRADLLAGKTVMVIAVPASAGTFTAQTVLVEKDGVAPPM